MSQQTEGREVMRIELSSIEETANNVHGTILHTNFVLENFFFGSNQLYMLTCNEFIVVIFLKNKLIN